MGYNIPSIIFGIISFFLSFLMMRVFYPILSQVLNLFSAGSFIKISMTLMTYLVFFAILYIVPYNIFMGKTPSGQDNEGTV